MNKNDLKILKRLIIAGIPAGLFLTFVGAITTNAGIMAYLSTLYIDVQSWMISVAFYNIMIGLLLVLVYQAVYKGLEGDNPVTKGLLFGILVWMIQTMPSIINSFLHSPQLFEFVRLELITGFVAYPLVGVIIAFTFDRYIKA